MAHCDAWEGKWRGNWRMEWAACTLHTTTEHGVSSITTADVHTTAASSRLNWRPRPVRFAERRNLVSMRVPSHFKRSLPHWRPTNIWRHRIKFSRHVDLAPGICVTTVVLKCTHKQGRSLTHSTALIKQNIWPVTLSLETTDTHLGVVRKHPQVPPSLTR